MHLHAAKVPPLRNVGSLATWLDDMAERRVDLGLARLIETRPL